MFGSHSMTGRRKENQDAMCCGEALAPGYRIFGIYDGHGGLGGGRCSNLASTKLTTILRSNLRKALCNGRCTDEVVGQILTASFKQFDEHLKSLPKYDSSYDKRDSWKKIFTPARSADFNESGSCACVAISTPDSFVVANLGDSRAILSDGKRITNDHTSFSLSELKRVYDAGGWAENNRIFGVLIPTRAFGDLKMKYPKGDALPITHVPEIHIISKTPDMPRYLVIMCDGIHNALKDIELAKFCEGFSALHPKEIAECVTEEAYKRGSKDNLSVIVIRTCIDSVYAPALLAHSSASTSSLEDFSAEEKEQSSSEDEKDGKRRLSSSSNNVSLTAIN